MGIPFEETNFANPCAPGQYKVALVINNVDVKQGNGSSEWDDRDYHRYRQNPDGTWSHKPGHGPVTNLDASQNFIWNPETSDRNYYKGALNYNVFVGYYCVGVPEE